MTQTDIVEALLREIEPSEHTHSTLSSLTRAILRDDQINVRADEARAALEGAPRSFGGLMGAIEAARVPFELRAFDQRGRLIQIRIGTELSAFFRAALKTLSRARPSSEPDIDADDDLLTVHSLGSLWAGVVEDPLEATSEEFDVAELTERVVGDQVAALSLAGVDVTTRTLYVLTGRLMEHGGWAPHPGASDDADQTRYERTRANIRAANNGRNAE